MKKIFSIGDTISGYCNGYFGRDDYYEKICVLVTHRYALFQYISGPTKGDAIVLNRQNNESLDEATVNDWKNHKETEY